MNAVQELDKTLFESYFKPKSAALTSIVREGILDPQMDWYETPQPKGAFFYVSPELRGFIYNNTFRVSRDSAIRVRNTHVPRGRACASQRRCGTFTGAYSECPR